MAVKCDEYNKVCVLTLAGDLAGDENTLVQNQMEAMIETRHLADFVVDFEKCHFIDSKGLSTLLWAKRRCEDLFGQFKLANLDDNCRKILEITRLSHRFESHNGLESALKTMS
ncbi:MAG TPA: STAS domain-containing protein [Tepidisphaeraceae bacterium]|nr:STAS domain-containing protein [Tepidisphaeraceae bacterium]